MKLKQFFFGVFILISFLANGNNLSIHGLQQVNDSTLSFSISWENSWYLKADQSPGNHDAVWVFCKYAGKDGIWHHLEIKSGKLEDSMSSDLILQSVKDEKGIFIKRKDFGSDKIPAVKVDIIMTSSLRKGNFNFRIFGIEMVWVTQGAFYLGDGSSVNAFCDGASKDTFRVSSENQIVSGTDAGQLNTLDKYAPEGNIPEKYPKGYSGFYMMKYEITQEQYAAFLNCLTIDQQRNRTAVSPESASGVLALTTSSANRNGVAIAVSAMLGHPAVYGCDANGNGIFNEIDDGQNRACNFLSWDDLTAYLDWAALRPMTELEFEKSCRGPNQPVASEFAWGTSKITDANTIRNDGTPYEKAVDKLPPNSGLGSHGYDGPQGPLRAGFGGSDTSTRLSIGAGFYGALELSGNLWEQCVTTTKKGLQFEGNAGDGQLDQEGFCNEPMWPGKDHKGAGFRGGAWNSGIAGEFCDLAVADRFYAYWETNFRKNTYGGRGVRSIGY